MTVDVVDQEEVVEGLEQAGVEGVEGVRKRGGHARWNHEENLLLWECYEESRAYANGEEGWKETLIVEWQRRGTRALKLETVVGRVK